MHINVIIEKLEYLQIDMATMRSRHEAEKEQMELRVAKLRQELERENERMLADQAKEHVA